VCAHYKWVFSYRNAVIATKVFDRVNT
jgi:hypothetical protein